jgi:NAD(P)-dependent dehydrogenase (short-subunit alcohol dehydrogenase family)
MPVAIVTGASEGFGRALAEDLAKDGWDLVIDARHAGRLQATATALAAYGTTVRALVGDIADAGHRQALMGAVESLGRLDLLVNNASTLGPTPLPDLASFPIEDLAGVYRVNVLAPLAIIQLALPVLVASKGSIVNVTSDAAVEAYEGWGGYGSSKAALEQVSQVLSAEQPGVRVYSFDPGDMRTRMHQDAFPGEDISDRPAPTTVVPALRRLLRNAPPSGRYRASELLDSQLSEPQHPEST